MLQLCALLEKVTVQMLSWPVKCSHRRAGNQLVMPGRKIDARDGVKRRESSHAYLLNIRPPREVVAFVPAPRSNPREQQPENLSITRRSRQQTQRAFESAPAARTVHWSCC